MSTDRERGSVLLLVPAGILVLLVLGAVAVDSAVVFLGQRELGNAVAAAANDAAAAAFAEAPFYEGGEVELDLAKARDVAAASVAARKPAGLELRGAPDVTVSGRRLCVAVEAEVRRIFASGIPGASRSSTIRATSSATLTGESLGPLGPPGC